MNKTKVFSIKGKRPFYFYQNINYFYNTQEGTIIFLNNETLIVKESSRYVMNYLCELFLTDLKTYFKTLKRAIKTKYKNPVYLNKQLIFIYSNNINDYDNIWINYSNISHYTYQNNYLRIKFKSEEQIEIKIEKTFINKQIQKIEEVKTYLKQIR